MKITESRLRRIIRSVILESASNSMYEIGEYNVTHDDLIDFLVGFLDEGLLAKLEANPDFLNAVMKYKDINGRNFEEKLEGDYIAEQLGYMEADGSWIVEFEDVAHTKGIEKAESEIYNNSIEDVQSIIKIYRKYFSDNSFKQSFVNVLKTFGYPQHAVKSALSDVGLSSVSYDDHDYSV